MLLLQQSLFIYISPGILVLFCLKKVERISKWGEVSTGFWSWFLVCSYIYVYDTHIRTLAWHYETTSYSSYYEYGYWYQRPEHHTT